MGGSRWTRAATRLSLGAALCAVALSASAQAAESDPCAGVFNELRVDTTAHSLHLCEDGATAHVYPVALGGRGVGKQKEGDRKTPLGRYRLSRPRKSKSYGTFVLLGYPTREQRDRGLTGGDVGIHGPPRSVAKINIRIPFDWTDGCIALDTDEAIEAVARWIERTNARWVELR